MMPFDDPDLAARIIAGSAYATAFLAGLLGGVHCAGMCGGIAGALGMGLPREARGRTASVLPFLLAYNAGRILSYVTAGAAVGTLGFVAGEWLAEYRAWFWLRLVAGGVMVAMGLYLAGWWFGLTRLERAGAVVWARLKPLGRPLVPPRHPVQALALGAVWGWLPCGLVYSALLWSLAAGGWAQGALFMLFFGAGTLPTLLALGFAAARPGFRPGAGLRRTAGVLVIGFGLWTLVATLVFDPGSGLGCSSVHACGPIQGRDVARDRKNAPVSRFLANAVDPDHEMTPPREGVR